MHRVDGPDNDGGLFTEGTPGLDPATVVTADIMNAIQEELVNAIENCGQTLNKPNNQQLMTGLRDTYGALDGGNTWFTEQVFEDEGTFKDGLLVQAGGFTVQAGATLVQAGLTATNSTTNGAGVTSTGNGTGAGLVVTGGSSSGNGITATGGATNGVGVTATGTGTGAGVTATGGGTNANGVTGTGGATNGIGVRGIGSGSGQGVYATSSTGQGVYAEGGGSSSGVRGTGGATNGVGVEGFGGGTGAGGSFANGTAATGGTPRNAVTLANGYLSFGSTANPNGSVAFTNTVTPASFTKAWAVFSVASGTVTVTASHNVTSVTVVNTNDVRLTFASSFTPTPVAGNPSYCVHPQVVTQGRSCNPVPASFAATTVDLRVFTTSTGATVDVGQTSTEYFMVTVGGLQ